MRREFRQTISEVSGGEKCKRFRRNTEDQPPIYASADYQATRDTEAQRYGIIQCGWKSTPEVRTDCFGVNRYSKRYDNFATHNIRSLLIATKALTPALHAETDSNRYNLLPL